MIDRPKKVDVEKIDEEQLVDIINNLSSKVLVLFDKAKEEANKLLEPYGAKVDVNIAVRLKDR